MSVELTLTGSALTVDGWDEVLRAFAEELDEPLLDEPCFVQDEVHLLGPGSIRGVALRHEADALEARLPALASRADWRLAYAVLRRGLEAGGGRLEHEDGHTLGAQDLTPERADADGALDFQAAASVVHEALREGQAVTLPVGAFSLVVRPGDLAPCATAEEVPAAEAPLAARVARYAAAYPASTLTLTGGVRLTTWARIPTLVGRAHLVALEGLERPVPLARARDLLGARAEDVGDGAWYLPGLDPAADAALIAALEREQVDLERWAEEHQERLAAEAAGEEPHEVVAGEDAYGAVREIAGRLVAGLAAKKNPEDVRRALVREGHAAGTVDLTLLALSRALAAFHDAGASSATPRQVFDGLVEGGLPEPLAEIVLTALLGAAEQD